MDVSILKSKAVGKGQLTLRSRTLIFLGIAFGVVLLKLGLCVELLRIALTKEFASHILLIPFVSVALILRKRSEIFSGVRSSLGPGLSISILAIVVAVFTMRGQFGSPVDAVSMEAAALVILIIGAFLCLFGAESFQKALFPLLFLFFMVPIPESILKLTVLFLQKGSAEASAILFNLTGTPFFRDGFIFALPGTTIEIARECSGIRSSLALAITCLIGGHLMLDKGWKKLILVVAAIPVAMFKNAVRIVTLSLLAIHVDMSWLTNSRLHHEGGIVFFLLGLVTLSPLVWLLQRSERRHTAVVDATMK